MHCEVDMSRRHKSNSPIGSDPMEVTLQVSGCLSEANPKGRKEPRESLVRKGFLYYWV